MLRAAVYSLAALVLAIASVAIWHWRFEVDPGALPEARLDRPPVGWSSPENRRHDIEQGPDGPVLVLERSEPGGRTPGINLMFTRLERAQYVHIRCEARWQDVKVGPRNYMIARFVSVMKDASGRMSHPKGGFQVFGGLGDSDWRRYEVVQELTADMEAYGLSIAMLGASGRLEVRNLSVLAVRQRGWVRPAAVAVLLGWSGLLAALIRSRPPAPSWPRTVAGAVMMVACGWILVFPQTRHFLHPAPRHFDIGERGEPGGTRVPEPPAPKDERPPPAQENTDDPSPVPAKPELVGKDRPLEVEAPQADPPRKARRSGWLHRFLFEVNRRFAAAHLVLFTGVTLAFLAITGSASQWRLPLALALLSEVVPELTDHLGGWDDWLDLVSNLAGVGLAVLAWRKLPLPGRIRAPAG